MRSLHNRCAKQPMAVLLDNCRVHDFEDFYKYCDKFDIQIIWNAKYRPDFNGIEFVWGRAKKHFRAQVDWFKANGVQWNEVQLVEEVLKAIPQDEAVKLTKKGLDNIEKGEPVFPHRFVQGPMHQLKLVDLTKIMKPSKTALTQMKKALETGEQIQKVDPPVLPNQMPPPAQYQEELEERDEEINEMAFRESASYSDNEEN